MTYEHRRFILIVHTSSAHIKCTSRLPRRSTIYVGSNGCIDASVLEYKIECTIGGSTSGGWRVTGTIQRNHIGAVHVFRLHRAIHTIHVTTCLSSYTCWYASLARGRAGRNLEQVSNTPHHRTSLFKSPHTDCSNPSTPQSTQHPMLAM